MAQTNWSEIAHAVEGDCPSSTLRTHTIGLLDKVQHLGPLGAANAEFVRVYKFLTYNEPSRLLALTDELLAAFERGDRTPPARHNAWNYVVGALDLWLSRARVFYTAAGLIEGALKARLDVRMQDHFGEKWPTVADAIPSTVRQLKNQELLKERVALLRRLAAETEADDPQAVAALIENVSQLNVDETPEYPTGASFLKAIDFGKLRSFFQAKRLWNKGPLLQDLFAEPDTGAPPLRSHVDDALEIVHQVRNDVAHYRPSDANGTHSRFTAGLYGLAKLARWMKVDLQHFYGSVDTRYATELSLLIEDPSLLTKTTPVRRACAETECSLGEPLSVLLKSAPTDPHVFAPAGAEYACLYHRVQLRVALHRPHGE